jgi:hypothetical protein
MFASFACTLGTVRNTFIKAGVAQGDVNNEVALPLSVPLKSTNIIFGSDNGSTEKGTDSGCAEPDSDSTNGSLDGTSDCDSTSSDCDSDMLQQVTEQCCPDENRCELEVQKSCLVTSDEQADVKMSSDPTTDMKSTPLSGHQSEVETVEKPSPVFNFRKVGAERARWADMFDDSDCEDCSPVVARVRAESIDAKVSPSTSEGDTPIAERKINRTAGRRKSLIDKALIEQQNPGKSKLRSSAPVFVPMALEAKATADGQKVCRQCGATGGQHYKFCNLCGAPFQQTCGFPPFGTSLLIQ